MTSSSSAPPRALACAGCARSRSSTENSVPPGTYCMYSSRNPLDGSTRWSKTRTMWRWSSWARVCGSVLLSREIFTATSRCIDRCLARNTRANAPRPRLVIRSKSSTLVPGSSSSSPAGSTGPASRVLW
ncbi:Uncharacterised protein [Mycobacteroides abscessus subsp. abscessus]|nr:Uncharacterised protein [Mycobacteroides abscessus subsp. abscessus]